MTAWIPIIDQNKTKCLILLGIFDALHSQYNHELTYENINQTRIDYAEIIYEMSSDNLKSMYFWLGIESVRKAPVLVHSGNSPDPNYINYIKHRLGGHNEGSVGSVGSVGSNRYFLAGIQFSINIDWSINFANGWNLDIFNTYQSGLVIINIHDGATPEEIEQKTERRIKKIMDILNQVEI